MTGQVRMGAAIESAREAAGLSQRALEDRTGISQSTLSRILSGKRTAKMTEIILIAEATGCTVGQLTGTLIADRVEYAARATNDSEMEKMRRRLLHFIELDAYLDDQAIGVPQ
ncbi:helix-turn-helix domain-containing protein [Pseudactinotalea sp. HY160]|uniref:helix-turn-helix domain-containing protein n=1 Tax=Pseudactinotalea sp. HY160 TaxID=2654490 RepID=UPI00128B1678|nr:helix-turn-helix transcriptional regulator [Pseudactinotalea sp. HY160]MPV51357.1 helix-turn-helix domain-containing protein [Pseudactinotalea sp. HY160]